MSLLLDARRKVELALEQSGVQKTTEPGLSETLRPEGLPAGGRDTRGPHHANTQRASPAGSTPEGAPPLHSDPRASGQNLFDAKAAAFRTRGRLGIIPVAIISGLVLAAGGGYYVWREISPPPMQRHSPVPPPATPLANATQPATPLAIAMPPAAPVAQTAPAPATSAAPTTSIASAKSIPVKNKPATAGAGMKRIYHASKAAAPHTPPPAPQNTAAQPIHIEHGQDSTVDPTLLAAWHAYRSGDFDTAMQRYNEVLHKDAKNRDALLGMAAIAQQQSQDAVAVRYYGQVLMLDPRDPIANAGMSALLGTSDAAATESRLKILLAQQSRPTGTQSAALHFALGNLYAEQSRWGDAQQAYFNACNLEQDNAQFAFNLAVSLDHLGQGKLAAQHYQRALQLDLSDNPGFNRAQTRQRINELTAP